MGFKHVFASAFFAAIASSPALSEQHMVIVTGFSFFPETVYVQPGDTVLFINKSGEIQTVTARDGSWRVGPIANEDEAVLTINTDTVLDYRGHSTSQTEADPIGASLSFETPPLG